MNTRQWRQRGLFGALAMTVVWGAVSGKGSPAADQSSTPTRRTSPAPRAPAPSVPQVQVERLQQDDAAPLAEAASSNPFAAMTWHVPPPPPPPPPPAVQPPPAPPPSAPPVPFTFLGRYEEGGVRTIMLVRDERIYTVSEGDVIDKTYRIERLTTGQLEMTYLPLGTRQSISTGGT